MDSDNMSAKQNELLNSVFFGKSATALCLYMYCDVLQLIRFFCAINI